MATKLSISYGIPEGLNLIIFVLKCGYSFDEGDVKILKSVINKWKIS